MASPLLDYQDDVEIEPSLASRLGHVGLSGVAAVGNLLDTPGSMVRDVLSFENPLDNLLNPFSGANRTSGRDLLRKAGLVGKDDTYGNWWGGFAAEVLTDPLTYLGVGALLKGGQAATTGTKGLLRAGIPFTKHSVELGTGQLAESAAKTLGKAASYAGKTYPARFAKQLFDPRAGGVVDELGQKISGELYDASKSSGIELRRRTAEVAKDINETRSLYASIFGDDVAEIAEKQLAGATPAQIDMAGPNIKPPQLPGEDLARVETPTFGQMPKGGKKPRSKIADDLVNNVFDRLLGFVADTGSLEDAMKQVSLPLEKMTPELGSRVLKLVDTMRSATGKSYDEFLELGGKGQKLEELAEGYTPKSVSLTESYKQLADDVLNAKNKELDDYLGGADPAAAGYDSKMIEAQLAQSEVRRRANGGVAMTPEMEKANAIQHFPRYGGGSGGIMETMRRLFTTPGSSFARSDELRHLPRDVVNKIATDPLARGKDAVKHIEETYGKHLGRGSNGVDEVGKAIPRWQSKTEHATALAGWAKQHAQFPPFNNTILDDWYRYEHQVNTANLTLKTIHNLLADTIGPAVQSLAKGVPVPVGATGYITVHDVFAKGANMDAQASSKYLAQQLSQKLGKQIDPKDVLKMQVPEEVANAIAGVKRVHDEPEWMQALGGAVDDLTNIFKQNVTIPFPSFWTRNLTGGQFINMMTGYVTSPQDIAEYGKAFRDTFQTLRNLDEDTLAEMFIEGVINPTMLSEGVELAGGAPRVFRDFRHPLDVRQAYREVAGEVTEAPTQFSNPLLGTAAKAIDATRTGYGTAMRVGEKMSGAVEFMNRATMYIYLKRKGWSPRAAADKVAELQIDYSKATPFERNVMKRLVPFYSWHRGVAPIVLGTLARNPAGPLAQVVRASRLASSDDPTMPEWLGDTLAIENPLGSAEPGGSSYITGLGLPHESTLGFFGGGLRGMGREALSQLNPLIKAPLEWSTGTSFFQSGPGGAGRPLDEMNPPIGQTLANIARFAGRDPSTPVPTPGLLEFAVSNSPLTRYVTTARQITDPRKHPLSLAANILTGVRATDVSPAAEDAILRGRANELIRQIGGKRFTQSYFPKDMPPQDQELASSLKNLLNELASRGRDRRAAEEVAQ